jgi:hypothetical protein
MAVVDKRKRWVVPVSKTAENTFNPIRNVVDTMVIKPNPNMDVIRLTIGMSCCVLFLPSGLWYILSDNQGNDL